MNTYALAEALGAGLLGRGWRVTTAESCTAGGIASAITDVPGASGWFEAGFVVYSNEAKMRFTGVDAHTLAAFGAVSEPVARDMALGAMRAAGANVAVAVSGIAGPGGGTPDKPIGTVCFAWAGPQGVSSTTRHYDGDRSSVRRQTVAEALDGLLRLLAEGEPQQA